MPTRNQIYVAVVALVAQSVFGTTVAEDRVEFNRDIRPILSENCYYCHGFDSQHREADLRLDTFEGATEDLGGYSAIEPGSPDDSELIQRILTDDPDALMPPPDSEKELTVRERELIATWIEQGAEYQEHWAWRTLHRPSVPGAASAGNETTGNDTPGNDTTSGEDSAGAIDAFISAQWKRYDVQPVGEATPRERLRRLSFDLRGIPPTFDEVSAFQAAPSMATFNAYRDEWMSQLAFAEHQAVRWLDLVRWADTSGFVSDEPIASGAYRAWIIDAFRNNMAVDEFAVAQLAGDLLPAPTEAQLTASGYNRIVNTNCEAGAIELEQLYKLKGEHVRALGTVWLGMTTGCAECHDHKFDPILAKDYYSLAAFFDDLVEAGVYTPGDRREPLYYVHGEQPKRSRDYELQSVIDTTHKQILSHKTDISVVWEESIKAKLSDKTTRTDFRWVPTHIPAARVRDGQFTKTSVDERPARGVSATKGQFRRHFAAELMTGFFKHDGQKTDDEQDAWFVDVWVDPDDRPEMVGLQILHGDYGRLGWRTANYETYFWGEDTSGTLSESHPWSEPGRVKRLGDLPTQTGWTRLRVKFNELLPGVGGQTFAAVGLAWLQTGGNVGWGDSGMELRTDKATALQLSETGVRKWWQRPMNRQVYQRRNEYVSAAIKTLAADRDDLQAEVVAEAFCEHTDSKQMAIVRNAESDLWAIRATAMPVLVSKRQAVPKATRLLNRGDYLDTTGPMVTAAVPEFLGTLESRSGEAVPDRLDLANWMFSGSNPITPRVFVNRLWHQFFGRGLSETLEDSGTQGDQPSHVELLDWLAAEFRDSGWDRNHMIRLITSSKAYQLSSVPTPKLAENDPGNRWHGRQGRFRLPAEVIRDSALRAAGLLNLASEVPQRSFFPYQPDPYWTRSDKVMFGSRHMRWATSDSESQYQRSVYTFWKRQNIHPTMLAFDAPTRQECTARRNITNTPGQALALLNDPMFVEAARVLAQRICESGSTKVGEASASVDNARIRAVFQIALQRVPTAGEFKVVAELLKSQRVRYRDNTADAAELISIGQSVRGPQVSDAEFAAWTAVTRAVLNLHEFVNRS